MSILLLWKKNQREKIEEQLAGAATVSDSATSESEKTSRELQKYSSFIPALVLVQTLWIHKIRLKRNLHTISRELGQNELHTCDTSDESNFSQPKARKIKKEPKQLCTVSKWRKPDCRSETVRGSVYCSTAEPHAWKLAIYVNQQAEARNLRSTASSIQGQHNHNQSPNIHVHNLARKLQTHKPQNNQNRELSNKLWKAT